MIDLSDESKWVKKRQNLVQGEQNPSKPYLRLAIPPVDIQVNSYIVAIRLTSPDAQPHWYLGGSVARGLNNIFLTNPPLTMTMQFSEQLKLPLNVIKVFTFPNDGLASSLIRIYFAYWLPTVGYEVWEFQADNPDNPYGSGQFGSNTNGQTASYDGGVF